MTTASILSAVSMALTTILAALRAFEAITQGSAPLAVNRAEGDAGGASPDRAPHA